MSPISFGPKDEAAQNLGKEINDVLQAAFKKGPGRWVSAMNEGLQAVTAGVAFQSLMASETDSTEEASFDVKKVAYQIGLGIAMDNGKDFMSLDS